MVFILRSQVLTFTYSVKFKLIIHHFFSYIFFCFTVILQLKTIKSMCVSYFLDVSSFKIKSKILFFRFVALNKWSSFNLSFNNRNWSRFWYFGILTFETFNFRYKRFIWWFCLHFSLLLFFLSIFSNKIKSNLSMISSTRHYLFSSVLNFLFF